MRYQMECIRNKRAEGRFSGDDAGEALAWFNERAATHRILFNGELLKRHDLAEGLDRRGLTPMEKDIKAEARVAARLAKAADVRERAESKDLALKQRAELKALRVAAARERAVARAERGPMRAVNIYISDKDADQLRKLGGGMISEGVRIALKNNLKT